MFLKCKCPRRRGSITRPASRSVYGPGIGAAFRGGEIAAPIRPAAAALKVVLSAIMHRTRRYPSRPRRGLGSGVVLGGEAVDLLVQAADRDLQTCLCQGSGKCARVNCSLLVIASVLRLSADCVNFAARIPELAPLGSTAS
jgi:hypothetical protein